MNLGVIILLLVVISVGGIIMNIGIGKDEPNIFYILGIENRELSVSNFFAWLLNPKENHGLKDYFLYKFLKLSKIDVDLAISEVEVIREYYYVLDGSNNYIDILIKITNKAKNALTVIGIENKVFSGEGYKQTERYWRILNEAFEADKASIWGIYLTRSNLVAQLSNTNFKHVKYLELEALLQSCYKKTSHPLIRDFIRTYISDPRERVNFVVNSTFSKLQESCPDKGVFNRVVCQTVAEKFILDGTELFCDIGYSSNNGRCFFQLWDSSWFYEIGDRLYNIHIEGDVSCVKVHFETYPYEPYKNLPRDVPQIMDEKIKSLADIINPLEFDNPNIKVNKVRSNAVLTVGSFRIEVESFREFYDGLNDLIKVVGEALERVGLS